MNSLVLSPEICCNHKQLQGFTLLWWVIPACQLLSAPPEDCFNKAEGRPTVTWEDPLCAVLCRSAFLLISIFCAGFQPQAVSICASLFALDSWVLAFGPQLYPSSDLPHTAQLVPLVVKLWLGTCSGLVWRHDHCPFPACSVLWFFLFLVAVKSLARLSPLELVWLKEVVPWFLALLCDPHTF